MNVTYSFYNAIFLTGVATKVTEYVLLGINFVIDMKLCYQAIQFKRKISGLNDETEKKQNLENEVLILYTL